MSTSVNCIPKRVAARRVPHGDALLWVGFSLTAALGAPLRQFQAWRLRVFCRHCQVLVRLEVDRLVPRRNDGGRRGAAASV